MWVYLEDLWTQSPRIPSRICRCNKMYMYNNYVREICYGIYFRTYTYIEREIEKIPSHVPVLVLGNHRDMGHHRTVLEDKARYFCIHLDRLVLLSQSRCGTVYQETFVSLIFALDIGGKFKKLAKS